jgi:Cellulase (glycosyl hydrolase family 5)
MLLFALVFAALASPVPARAVVYGAAVGGDFAYLARGTWTEDQVRSSLEKLHAAGGSVARADADWAASEPKGPVDSHYRYDWRHDDIVIGALAAAHLRWDPTMEYTPRWAQQHVRPLVYHGKGKHTFRSPLPPANNAVYAAFVGAFARRYGVGGSFWRTHRSLPREPVTTFEIWNEPDDRWTWGPNVNLQDYARLYRAAYQAIKRVDPHSIVITGGLAFTQTSLPRLLKALAGLPIDGLAVHPYGSDANATIAIVRWTQTQMAADGRGHTPLIVNEYGWHSGTGTTQRLPGRALVRNVQSSIVGLSKIKQVSAVIPFEWSDPIWGLSGGAFASGIRHAHARAGTGADVQPADHARWRSRVRPQIAGLMSFRPERPTFRASARLEGVGVAIPRGVRAEGQARTPSGPWMSRSSHRPRAEPFGLRARRRLAQHDHGSDAPARAADRVARGFSQACEYGDTGAAVRLLVGDIVPPSFT